MKLNSLLIRNFRLLEDFEVKKLGRLNLIVGKNNSGKSTILEALRIYAGNANPLLLAEISFGHDEKYRRTELEQPDEAMDLPLEHFFTGRKFPEDDRVIYVGEKEGENTALKIGHVLINKQEEVVIESGEKRVIKRSIPILKADAVENTNYSGQGITVSRNGKKRVFAIDDMPPLRRVRSDWLEGIENISCSYIPTQFISIDALADIWDSVLFTEHEGFVKQSLEIISSDFENLAFVKSELDFIDYPRPRREFRRIAKVKLKNAKRPIPLNSMGDGMLRVLQLSLNVFPARGGFFLIDEFENGLHYSVQEKVWDLLFDLANRFDIQVFATTHSWDCIDSFAKVAARNQDIEGVLFRVGQSIKTSDKGKVIATEFDKEKLATLTQADVDVR